MRPKLTTEELEARRLMAGRLLLQGKKVREVARETGASPSSVSRWKASLTEGGIDSLLARRALGAKPRLNGRQRKRLVKILLRGPMKMGYRTDLWTCPRVAEVIERVFGVHYHSAHVWRLLHDQLGWTCQKPQRRARERDDEAVEQWRRRDWPRIKRGRAFSR